MEGLEFPLGRRTAFRLHHEQSMKGCQSDVLCSCFSPLKRQPTSWQKTTGPSTLKNVFETLFCIQYWQTLTSFSKRFLSFNLEARSSALSIKSERSQLRSFNSCWLNHVGSEVLSSGTYWSFEECWMVSGKELSSNSTCLKTPFHSLGALELANSHHEEFRCEYTILCLLFAEKPVTLTQHK
jgi:hypothetical protein